MFQWKNRKRGWIGIDFGSHSVKLAQVAFSGNRMEIQAAAVIPRGVPWTHDLATQEAATSSAGELDVAFFLNRNFSGTQSACTLSMAACDVRRMTIPENALRGALEHHVARALSSIDRFKGIGREFDFWETEKACSDTGPPANVLSVPSFWAEQCISDTREAGLDCDRLDGVPFTLTRAYSLFEKSHEPVALLDWGYSRATFCVIQNGYPKFVRLLRKSGFRQVMDEISRGFNLDRQQAREVVTNFGLEGCSSDDSSRGEGPGADQASIQQAFNDLVRDPVNMISTEIKRTVHFLEKQQKILAPVKLVLFGGGAVMKNVAPILESKVRMHTEAWGGNTGIRTPGNLPLPLIANAVALSALPLSKPPVTSLAKVNS